MHDAVRRAGGRSYRGLFELVLQTLNGLVLLLECLHERAEGSVRCRAGGGAEAGMQRHLAEELLAVAPLDIELLQVLAELVDVFPVALLLVPDIVCDLAVVLCVCDEHLRP
jgi:hypothetical protein